MPHVASMHRTRRRAHAHEAIVPARLVPAQPRIQSLRNPGTPFAEYINPTPSVAVAISNDPETRIKQSESFWRRNPGFFSTWGGWDIAHSVAKLLPGSKKFVDGISPTDSGYGQLMVDQMRWQIRSKRQPDSRWWMSVNQHLVGGGLVAEAYLRAGRAGELKETYQQAWLSYIILSDAIRAKVGGKVGEGYTKPAAIDDLSHTTKNGALSKIYKKASLLDRLEATFIWRPEARRAYWVAHDDSIQAGKKDSEAILRDEVVAGRAGEAAFGSAWAHTIKFMRMTNPIATSHLAITVQYALLPQYQPVDDGKPTLSQKMFVWLIGRFDNSFTAIHDAAAAAIAQQPTIVKEELVSVVANNRKVVAHRKRPR